MAQLRTSKNKKPEQGVFQRKRDDLQYGRTGTRETNRCIARHLVEHFCENLEEAMKDKTKQPFSIGDLLRLMDYVDAPDGEMDQMTEITWIDPDWAMEEPEEDD